MKIVVLAGGLSPERNVSFSTGSLVLEALRARGHTVALLDMYLGLELYEEGADPFVAALPPQLRAVGKTAPDLEAVRASRKASGDGLFGAGVLSHCLAADIVFLALHGAAGEDGRVQATFDLLGIRYTGSGYLGSAIAMDKDLTKRFLQEHKIRTPAWRTLRGGDLEAWLREITVPCVLKVLQSGSSLGVFIVKEEKDLRMALEGCLRYDSSILVEEYIEGRELTCGVLGEEALPTVEIVPQVAFYDYESKYQPGATLEVCPGRIAPALEAGIRETALRVHKALGLSVYSRSDFMVNAAGEVYFLEVNTLPGLTPTSLVPQEAAAIGLDYGSLCERILALSLEK